jgi:hypothetical protein
MAGSGQIKRVYDDRARWMKPDLWDLDLRLFDLTPRGPYRALIGQHDLLSGFPDVGGAPDYVIMDVPYFGLCYRQYSRRTDDIANMDLDGWTAAMQRLARVCAEAGAKRCTVFIAALVDPERRVMVQAPHIVRMAWLSAGYALARVCYAPRGIHATKTARAAMLNSEARKHRVPLNDMLEVLTFDLG